MQPETTTLSLLSDGLRDGMCVPTPHLRGLWLRKRRVELRRQPRGSYTPEGALARRVACHSSYTLRASRTNASPYKCCFRPLRLQMAIAFHSCSTTHALATRAPCVTPIEPPSPSPSPGDCFLFVIPLVWSIHKSNQRMLFQLKALFIHLKKNKS